MNPNEQLVAELLTQARAELDRARTQNIRNQNDITELENELKRIRDADKVISDKALECADRLEEMTNTCERQQHLIRCLCHHIGES